jgi:hypothetical protein
LLSFLKILLIGTFLNTLPASADDTNPSQPQVARSTWFKELGIGFRGGFAFAETATGNDFTWGHALGCELNWGVFRYKFHRVSLNGGYFHFGLDKEFGTEKLQVETKYQRVDITAGYDITWRLLTGGIRLGVAPTIITSTTTINEIQYWVEDNEVLYKITDEIDSKKSIGAQAAFLLALGIGVEFGELFGFEDLLELRIQGEYSRRNQRDDFTAHVLISFWPLNLKR